RPARETRVDIATRILVKAAVDQKIVAFGYDQFNGDFWIVCRSTAIAGTASKIQRTGPADGFTRLLGHRCRRNDNRVQRYVLWCHQLNIGSDTPAFYCG